MGGGARWKLGARTTLSQDKQHIHKERPHPEGTRSHSKQPGSAASGRLRGRGGSAQPCPAGARSALRTRTLGVPPPAAASSQPAQEVATASKEGSHPGLLPFPAGRPWRGGLRPGTRSSWSASSAAPGACYLSPDR